VLWWVVHLIVNLFVFCCVFNWSLIPSRVKSSQSVQSLLKVLYTVILTYFWGLRHFFVNCYGELFLLENVIILLVLGFNL
jgi:hypothetical protein